MNFKDNAVICLSVLVLCICLLTLGQLVIFLSAHSPLQLNYSPLQSKKYSLIANSGDSESVWSPIATNLCCLSLFVVQHSLQNHQTIKNAFSIRGYGAFERLVYNLGSCLALQVLMQYWRPVSSWVVWEVSTSNNIFFWWLFVIIHSIAWLLIYSGCYLMDLTELLGVKQVFYDIQGWPDPLSLKSDGLRRFYSHMRHPSFSAMSVILFVHPIMQMDRLLLAYGLVIYILLFTQVDHIDYAYQKRLFQRKERDLNFNE